MRLCHLGVMGKGPHLALIVCFLCDWLEEEGRYARRELMMWPSWGAGASPGPVAFLSLASLSSRLKSCLTTAVGVTSTLLSLL
jgi:hypothetical protein